MAPTYPRNILTEIQPVEYTNNELNHYLRSEGVAGANSLLAKVLGNQFAYDFPGEVDYESLKDGTAKFYDLIPTVDSKTGIAVKDLPPSARAMSDEAIMKEAIKQADAAVRMTQDSLLPEDRAAFQNMDPIVQSFTQFTGYFNMIANLGFTQYQKLMKDEMGFKFKGQNAQQLVYASMYAVVMPAIVAGIIMRLVNDRIEDEDEDGYILDDMAWAAFGDVVNYTAGLVPVAGQLALLPFNQFDDKPWNDDIVSSPGIEALATSSKIIFKFPFKIAKGELSGKDIRDVSTLFSMFGVPLTPLGRTFGYLHDVRSDTIRPRGPFDFIRGVVTGKASSTRN